MAFNFEALAGQLGIDVSPWVTGFAKAKAEASKFRAGLGQAMAGVNRVVNQTSQAFAAMGAAAAGAMAYSVKAADQFESTMARLKGVLSSRTADVAELQKQFASLTAEAKRLGIVTVFSSQKAAEGMTAFALAGFKTNEILKVMPGTLDLAAAAQVDVGVASDIVAKSLRGLGLEAENTAHLSDVLAKAFTSSNTDLVMLGDALKYVGPVTKMAGVSMEQAVAAIRALSDAGMQGQMAGTGLRNVLSHLAAEGPQVRKAFAAIGVALKDSSGQLRPLGDIIDDFNGRIAETGRQADATALVMNAFGDRGGPAFANLLGLGGEALRKYEAELQNAGGTAQKIAKTQLDTLHGSWILLTSSVQVLGIEIGNKLTPRLRELLDATTNWLNANIDAMASKAERWWDALASAVSRVVESAKRLWVAARPAVDATVNAMLRLKAGAVAVFDRLPQWAKDAVLVAGSLMGVSAVLGRIGGSLPLVGPVFLAISQLINPVGLLRGAFGLLSGSLNMLLGGFGVLKSMVMALVPTFAGATSGISAAWGRATASANTAMGAASGWARSVVGAGAASAETSPAVVAAARTLHGWGMESEVAAAKTAPLLLAVRALKTEMLGLSAQGTGTRLLGGPAAGPGTALALRNTSIAATRAETSLMRTAAASRALAVVDGRTTGTVKILNATFREAGHAAEATGRSWSLFGSIGNWLSGIGRGVSGWFGKLGGVFKWLAMSPVKLIVMGFQGVIATLGFLLNPITLVVAAFGSLAAAIGAAMGVAISRSRLAKQSVGGFFEGMTASIRRFIANALKTLNAWWEKNSDTIERVGTKFIRLFTGVASAIGDIGKTSKQDAPLIEKLLGGALDVVLGIAEKLFKSLESLVDLLNGDFRRSMVMVDRLAAIMADAFAEVFETMKDTPLFGSAFAKQAENMRRGAGLLRIRADFRQGLLDTEEQRKKDAAAKQEADRIANNYRVANENRITELNAAQAAEAETARKEKEQARIAEQRKYGSVLLDRFGNERAMSDEELDIVREQRRRVGMFVADNPEADKYRENKLRRHGLAVAAAYQSGNIAEARRLEREGPYAGVKFKTKDELAKEDDAKRKEDARNANPLLAAQDQPAAAASPVQTVAPAGSVAAATTSNAAGSSGEPDDEADAAAGAMPGTGHKKRVAVEWLDEGHAKKYRDAIAKLSPEQQRAEFGKLGDQVSSYLTPDKSGNVDTRSARLMLQNYSAMFSQLPNFSKKAWDQIYRQITASIDQIEKDTDPKVRDMAIAAVKEAASASEKVILDAAGQQKQVAASLARELITMTADQRSVQMNLAEQRANSNRRLTQEQRDELSKLRQQMDDTVAAAKNANAQTRDAAVKAANDAAEAYVKAYQRITKAANDAAKAEVADGRKVVAAAQQEANARRQRLAAAGPNGNGGGGPNQNPNGPKGGQNPGQNGNQPAGPNLTGNSPQARRARIAAMQQMVGGQPDLFQQVGGMSNQLSGMMTGAINTAMAAGAQGNAMVQQMFGSMSPLAKINTQIASAGAQLQAAQIDHVAGPILQQMQTELKNLQMRRQNVLAQEHHARYQATLNAAREHHQQQMQRDFTNDSSQKQLNENLSSIVIVGRRALMSPVQININGVNDIREAVDKIQLEMKRRGWLPGHRNTLETRKMW